VGEELHMAAHRPHLALTDPEVCMPPSPQPVAAHRR
jgi:hypothetical protein